MNHFFVNNHSDSLHYAQRRVIQYTPPAMKEKRKEYREDSSETSNFSTNGEENVDSDISCEQKHIHVIQNARIKTMAKIQGCPKIEILGNQRITVIYSL